MCCNDICFLRFAGVFGYMQFFSGNYIILFFFVCEFIIIRMCWVVCFTTRHTLTRHDPVSVMELQKSQTHVMLKSIVGGSSNIILFKIYKRIPSHRFVVWYIIKAKQNQRKNNHWHSRKKQHILKTTHTMRISVERKERERKKVAFSFFLFAWQNLILMTGFPGNALFSCFLLVFSFCLKIWSTFAIAIVLSLACLLSLCLGHFQAHIHYIGFYLVSCYSSKIYFWNIYKNKNVVVVKSWLFFSLQFFLFACMQFTSNCYVFTFVFLHFV